MSNSRTLNRAAAILATAVLSLTGFQAAQAQSVADNIRPVAKVCLEGQSCVGSAVGGSSVAMPATTATTSAPAAAVEAVAEVAEAVAEVVLEESGFDAAAKYQMSCFACHGTGAAGAPKLDDKAAWEEKMAKGMDAVMVNVMNGIGAMPAKGLCMDCSDSDLVALVEYMSSQ
ncbi:MAG: cytochrome c5 family protein [Pseudohongiellaceae bacterium]